MQHTQQEQGDVLQQAQKPSEHSVAEDVADAAGHLQQTSLQSTQNA